MAAYVLFGGRVLLPSGLEDVSLRIEDGRIAEVGDLPRTGAVLIDATGLTLAPALIDIHGDAFERQMMPRPKVFFPMDVAAIDTDRQLATNGIATAYHALTLSWEPGLRSVERGAAFIAALEENAARLTVDHRLQLRWETFAFDAVPLIATALQSPKTPSVAFNDHTSMGMRSFDTPLIDRPFEQSPAFETADIDDPRMDDRLSPLARRAGLDLTGYRALLKQVWSRRGDVDGMIREIAGMAAEVGAPMLSHDDTQEETRAYYRALGAGIAEFPMSEAVARRAQALGEAVVLGAPNVLRGGSHIGSLSAADMIEDGVCTVLASDYAYPAMLGAMGRLMAEKRGDLSKIWSCVSANAASALGLDDRGDIAPGKRADLVALDWPSLEKPHGGSIAPAVKMTMSGGRLAYLGDDLLRTS